MSVVILLLVFSLCCVLFGGYSAGASRLYYDGDFPALYRNNSSLNTTSNGEDSNISATKTPAMVKAGEEFLTSEFTEALGDLPADMQKDNYKIPVTLDEDVLDPRMKARDLYDHHYTV